MIMVCIAIYKMYDLPEYIENMDDRSKNGIIIAPELKHD